ncbi:MAG: HD domain-containing protein [Firmicutes bacterium]|nr:HD domain-containing protein [Bacillota bacterium]
MENNSRLLKLQNVLLDVIAEQEGKIADRDESLNWERIHLASSAQLAWQMALERGADPELTACAAAIHDLGRILTGRKAGHAEAAYEPAKSLLSDCGLFSDEEIEIMALAAKNHSSKDVKGTVIEEIIKDADVVDCCQHGYSSYYKPEVMQRYYDWIEKQKK